MPVTGCTWQPFSKPHVDPCRFFVDLPNCGKTLATYPAFRLCPVHRGQFGEVLSFLRQTVHTILECPRLPGTIMAEVVLAVH